MLSFSLTKLIATANIKLKAANKPAQHHFLHLVGCFKAAQNKGGKNEGFPSASYNVPVSTQTYNGNIKRLFEK